MLQFAATDVLTSTYWNGEEQKQGIFQPKMSQAFKRQVFVSTEHADADETWKV